MSHDSGARHEQTPAPETDPFAIRSFQPGDEASVSRLSSLGLLPEWVEYDSGASEKIQETYLANPRHHFWVAETAGTIIGTIAIDEISPDVGHLHWLRVDNAWQGDHRVARRLVQTAAAHASQMGFLKLVFHAPPHAQSRVEAFFQLLGFQFSRSREVGGLDLLEFYLNLYAKPQLGPGNSPET